jgi:hypothetical protein
MSNLFVELEYFPKKKKIHYIYKTNIKDEKILLLHPNYLKLREAIFVDYGDDFTVVIYKLGKSKKRITLNFTLNIYQNYNFIDD